MISHQVLLKMSELCSVFSFVHRPVAQQKWYNKEKRDYFNMYGYRISVFEVLWKNQVIRFLLIFSTILFLSFFQRVRDIFKSGGSMLILFILQREDYTFTRLFFLEKRIVPLAEIRQIDIDYVRGRRMNGDRYHLYFTRKDGKSFTFHFGKAKETRSY